MYFLGQKPSLGWGSSWSETPDAEGGSLEQGERGKKPQKQDHLGWKRPVIYKDLQEVQAAKQTWQSFRLSVFLDIQFCYTTANYLVSVSGWKKEIIKTRGFVRVDLMFVNFNTLHCLILPHKSSVSCSGLVIISDPSFLWTFVVCWLLRVSSGTTNGAKGITSFIFFQIFHVIFQWVSMS